MAIDFGKFKGASAQKSLENQANTPRETQGGGDVGYGIFDLSKAPFPIKKWEPKKGKNVVLILPLEVTSKQNPAFVAGAIGLGEYDYGVSMFTHMGKGTAAGVSHICLKRNYGKLCPRCEEFFLPPEKGGTFVKGVKGSGNQDHASSERNYFLVVPFDADGKSPDEENMGLWNAPANSRSGFPVVERAKEMADGAPIIPFWWPTDEGRLVQFEMHKEDGGFAEYKAVKFLRRDTKIAASLAEKYSFPLDSMLIVKTPDQINEDMFGGPERESAPASRAPEREPEEDKEPEMDPDAFGAPEPKESVKEDIVEAEYTEVPKAEATKTTPAPATASEGPQCPYGHVFGKEYSDHKGDTGCKACRKNYPDIEIACAEAE
jgi:hypothetical protein